MAKETITGVPQYQEHRDRNLTTQVAAKPVDALVVPSQDWELNGLIDGLKDFNPHLQQYLQTQDRADLKAGGERATANMQLAEIDPLNPTQVSVAPPPNSSVAFMEGYSNQAGKVLGERLGIQAAARLRAEHDTKKNTEDYNPYEELPGLIKEQTSGLQDPLITSYVAKHLNDTVAGILAEDRTIKYNKFAQDRIADTTVSLNDLAAKSGGDPEKFIAGFNESYSTLWGASQQYMSKNDFAKSVVATVAKYSTDNGGTPLLFDALNKRDKDGMSLAERYPELGVEVARLKHGATEEYKKRLDETNQQSNFLKLSAWDKDLEGGKPKTDQEIVAELKPGGLFKTHDEAASYKHRQDAKMKESRDLATSLLMINNGTPFLSLSGEQQKKAADFITKPLVDSLHGMMNDPDQIENIKKAGASLVYLHTSKNITVPNTALAGLMDGLSKITVDPSGKPSPRFLAAVELYRTMPPNIREMYVKDDSKQLLDSYVQSVDNQVEPDAAYKGAYMGISPDVKRATKERMESPEGKAVIAKATHKAVDNLEWVMTADYVPGRSNLPDNANIAREPVRAYLASYMATNPGASDDDLQAQAKRYTSNNYVHDVGSNQLVGVPPGVGQSGKNAIKLSMELLESQYGKESKPTLVHMGNGNYMVFTAPNGGMAAPVATTTWKQIQDKYSSSHLTPEDFSQITSVNKKAAAGTLTIQDVNDSASLASKLRVLGQSHKLPLGAINRVTNDNFNSVSANTIPLTMGDVGSAIPPANGDRAANNYVLNSLVGGVGASNPLKLSAALTAAREGTVLTASGDPNPKAGNNIGMGYNLNSHQPAETKEHFRRAGINPGSYEAIRAGKMSITYDQAQRLLEVTLPEYRKMAQEVVENQYPGRWKHLTPDQQAVITDVSYQTGRGGVSKFKESISAMFSGDPEKLKGAFRVNYKDSTGTMKEDTNGTTLRSAMLRGSGYFVSFLRTNKYLKD